MNLLTILRALFCLVLLTCAFWISGTQAAAPQSLGKFGYWQAYQINDGGGTVCYMTITAKSPVKKGEKKAKRGDVILMITHRPSEGSTDVISYSVGAKFKPASDVVVKIGGKTFSMFTQDDAAWSRDNATDRAITAALRGGQNATFSGTLASGAALADTVSLKGSDDAYYAISRACGLAVSKPKAPAAKAVAKPAPKTIKKPAAAPAKKTP